MTIFFNFFGGPGTGKSSAATYCFSMSKDYPCNSEYVPEKAKEWAWEKRNIKLIHQFELFQRQSHREARMYEDVGVVFADSPVWLSAYYSSLQKNKAAQEVVEELCREHYSEAKEKGVTHYNIWLTRVKPYNPKGRFQNEAGAKEIDLQMRPYLESLGVTFIDCDGIKEEAWYCVRDILKKHPEAKI